MKGGIGLRRKIFDGDYLTSIYCGYLRRKLLKTTHTKERSVHISSESCNIHSDRKKICLIPIKSQILQSISIDLFGRIRI